MHDIKSSIKYYIEKYLSNKRTFIKIDLIVAKIIASIGLRDPQTSTL